MKKPTPKKQERNSRYLLELKEGAGHLNPVKEKTSDKAPDYNGYIKINDEPIRIVAWVHSGKNGKYLSVRVQDEYNYAKPTTL
jgi:uncharacterized protein (DUF736 family)